jgi:hypothetical protein
MKDLDHPKRVLLADIILKAVRQQRLLHPIFAIDEPMHRHTPEAPSLGILKQARPRRNPPGPQSRALFTQAGPFSAIAQPGRARSVGRQAAVPDFARPVVPMH